MPEAELSTHIARKDRRLNDDWLELWLEDWGVWMRTPLKELCYPVKTVIKAVQELRLVSGKSSKAVTVKCKSTRVSQGITPNYMPHLRMGKLDRVIQDLGPKHRDFIHDRFEHGGSHQDMKKRIGMTKDIYYKTLREAKKEIKKRLKNLHINN